MEPLEFIAVTIVGSLTSIIIGTQVMKKMFISQSKAISIKQVLQSLGLKNISVNDIKDLNEKQISNVLMVIREIKAPIAGVGGATSGGLAELAQLAQMFAKPPTQQNEFGVPV